MHSWDWDVEKRDASLKRQIIFLYIRPEDYWRFHVKSAEMREWGGRAEVLATRKQRRLEWRSWRLRWDRVLIWFGHLRRADDGGVLRVGEEQGWGWIRTHRIGEGDDKNVKRNYICEIFFLISEWKKKNFQSLCPTKVSRHSGRLNKAINIFHTIALSQNGMSQRNAMPKRLWPFHVLDAARQSCSRLTIAKNAYGCHEKHV